MGPLQNTRRLWRAVCRLLANHCSISPLRHLLFRCSGFKVGKRTFINMGVVAIDDYETGMVEIGDRASIAPNVTFVAVSSPNNSLLGTRTSMPKKGKIVVGQDAWIGAGAVILPSVTIHRCSVVAANAVVVEDVPPFCIVAGVPAKVIKRVEVNASATP